MPVDVTFDAPAWRFEETMNRARARVAAIRRCGDELSALRGRARSRDGRAEAVVDAGGRLVALWLAESATRRPASTVGALIVDTVAAAALDAAKRRDRVLADLIAELGR